MNKETLNKETLNKETLKSLAYWGELLGWTLLVAGAINAVIGLFGFLVGAIPGVFTFIMGQKLLSATKQAEALTHSDGDMRKLNALLDDLKGFFKIYGIFTIVSFILLGIIFALWILAFGFGMAYM